MRDDSIGETYMHSGERNRVHYLVSTAREKKNKEKGVIQRRGVGRV